MDIKKRQHALQKALRAKNKGATLTEYGIIVGLLAIVAIIAISALGLNVRGVYESVDNSLVGAREEAVAGGQEPGPQACRDVGNGVGVFAGIRTSFEENVWNPQGNGTEDFPEEVCLDYALQSPPSGSNPWVANWSIPGNGSDVIAFPNLSFGHKPWADSGSGVYGAPILDRNIAFSYPESRLKPLTSVRGCKATGG